jgi:hypothetical protein
LVWKAKKPKLKLKGLSRSIPLPNSSEELRTMLIERSAAAREKRVEIFVMDISKN